MRALTSSSSINLKREHSSDIGFNDLLLILSADFDTSTVISLVQQPKEELEGSCVKFLGTVW